MNDILLKMLWLFSFLLTPIFLQTQTIQEEKARLERVKELQTWGFLDEAEMWYEQLFYSSKYEEIQKNVLENWVRLLENRGKKKEKAILQEKIFSFFPEKQEQMQNELFHYYMEIWEWEKVKEIARDVLKKSTSKNIERYRLTLLLCEQWEKRKSVWKENFDGPLDWQISDPVHYKLDSANQRFEANIVPEIKHSAGKIFYWQGHSMILAFDIQINTIGWCDQVSFGLLSQTPSIGDRLLINFSCSGGQGDYHYPIQLEEFSMDGKPICHGFPKEFLPGTWYRVELDYLKEICSVRLTIVQKQGEIVLGQKIVILSHSLAPADYLFGFVNCYCYSNHFGFTSRVYIDNMEIKAQSWIK